MRGKCNCNTRKAAETGSITESVTDVCVNSVSLNQSLPREVIIRGVPVAI